MGAGTCMFGSKCSHRDTCTFKHPPVKNAGAGTAQRGTNGSGNASGGRSRGGANNQNAPGAQHTGGTGNAWATFGNNHPGPPQQYVAQNNSTPQQLPASIVINTHSSPTSAPTPPQTPPLTAAEVRALMAKLGAFLNHIAPSGTD